MILEIETNDGGDFCYLNIPGGKWRELNVKQVEWLARGQVQKINPQMTSFHKKKQENLLSFSSVH